MKLIPVDLKKELELSLDFRLDAHIVSGGDPADFDRESIKKWYYTLQEKNPQGFKHVVINGEIAGQVEFQIKEDLGYINLIYLKPEQRNRGLGKEVQTAILTTLKELGCKEARLRFYSTNIRAEKFYLKTGWTLESIDNSIKIMHRII